MDNGRRMTIFLGWTSIVALVTFLVTMHLTEPKYAQALKTVADYGVELGATKVQLEETEAERFLLRGQLNVILLTYGTISIPCKTEIDSLLGEYAEEEERERREKLYSP